MFHYSGCWIVLGMRGKKDHNGLLGVFDLDESLGMISKVFRLLFGALLVTLGDKAGVFSVERWEVRLSAYIQNKSIKGELLAHNNKRKDLLCINDAEVPGPGVPDC